MIKADPSSLVFLAFLYTMAPLRLLYEAFRSETVV